MRKGDAEGKRKFPGRAVSVQVNEMTDDAGRVIYKVMPMGGDMDANRT